MIVPYHRSWILDEDIERVVGVLRGGWLTSGPLCEAVEAELRRLTGAKHALVMASCTAALHAAVGVEPREVERLLATHNVIGIIAVHYAGIPCNVTKLQELARHYGVFLIEDAAHALGSVHTNGEKVGEVSHDGTALSFYATKNATSGEGGALLTDNDALAQFTKQFRYHGLTRIAWEREASPFDTAYDIADVGFKYNMPDMAAGLLLGQLQRFEAGQKLRREVAERYVDAFSGLPVHCMGAGLRGHAWHLFVLRTELARELGEDLTTHGVGVRRHYAPLHELSFLRSDPSQFPNSTQLSRSVVSLPLYPGLSEAEQAFVIDNVKEFFHG